VKILIAEDDTIPRRLLQATLTKAGHEVVSACDGAEAWQILQNADAPRLAIVDWLMPNMDGVEVCCRVRRRHAGPYLSYFVDLKGPEGRPHRRFRSRSGRLLDQAL
jgi:CheY-like chemotaxis protein